MKSINNFINESLEKKINEANITYKECAGYSFTWVSTKNRYAMRGEPKMRYHLVCIPDDKTKDIVVFKDFAWYSTGYDQGYNSKQQLYLNTLCAGSKGNGHGVTKECEPTNWDLKNDIEHIDCYLNSKKDWSSTAPEKLEKSAITYNRKTKISEIKRNLQN